MIKIRVKMIGITVTWQIRGSNNSNGIISIVSECHLFSQLPETVPFVSFFPLHLTRLKSNHEIGRSTTGAIFQDRCIFPPAFCYASGASLPAKSCYAHWSSDNAISNGSTVFKELERGQMKRRVKQLILKFDFLFFSLKLNKLLLQASMSDWFLLGLASQITLAFVCLFTSSRVKSATPVWETGCYRRSDQPNCGLFSTPWSPFMVKRVLENLTFCLC